MDARITCGDAQDLIRLEPAASVDSIVTDPPYKLSQEYGAGADADNLMAVAALAWIAPELLRVAVPGAVCALFYDSRILPFALESMRRGGWHYMRHLTLYRRWGSASMVHGWMSTSDFILLFNKPGAKPQFFGDAAHDVYVRAAGEALQTGHKAQKPIDVVRHIVARLTPPGGVVLDPFVGSGTTARAALLEGRRAVAFDIDPASVALAKSVCDGTFTSAAGQPTLFDEDLSNG